MTYVKHDKPSAPQDAYKLAFKDLGFLMRDEMRPVRLQLELLKPGLIMEEHNIHSTLAVFGSARTLEPNIAKENFEKAELALFENPDSKKNQHDVKIAKKALDQSIYYEEARRFARLISLIGQVSENKKLVVLTGGGPGIMEAANRGAADVGAISIGLNIQLPFEQHPNPYITPELSFLFHYFSIRKMHFLLRCKALAAFPGGFGSLDELFGVLTLLQTHKMQNIPVVLFGKKYWETLINFDFLIEEGMILEKDLKLFRYAETAEEGVEIIAEYYGL